MSHNKFSKGSRSVPEKNFFPEKLPASGMSERDPDEENEGWSH